MVEISGFAEEPFDNVKEVFRDNFDKRNEVGGSFCVYYNNKKVVEIWGGYKDQNKREKWNETTLTPVFSTSKAVSAACLALLHSRGYFEYDDKVCSYWPEFSQNGKGNITIQQLLQHRAGLSAIDKKLTPEIINNHKKLDKILAKQSPHWKPGTQQGYHVWTIGWYMSALLSRIDPDGRRISQFIKEEFNQKTAGEFYIGIDNDFNMGRLATLIPFSKLKGFLSMPFKFVKEFFKPWSVTFKSMLNPFFASDHSNFKHSFADNKQAFGGFGAGGSFVIIDPKHNITIAYTMNKMSPKIMNGEREVALRDSVYKSIKNVN